MRLSNMNDLYSHELRDLYNAETRLIDALPRMASKATSKQLRDAFQSHLNETKKHRSRLEDIFKDLKQDPAGERCEAMEGILKESEEILTAEGEASTIDAGLVAMANRVEHYEMAAYGAARTHAKGLGHDKHAEILQQTLTEEGNADKKLKELSRELNTKSCSAC